MIKFCNVTALQGNTFLACKWSQMMLKYLQMSNKLRRRPCKCCFRSEQNGKKTEFYRCFFRKVCTSITPNLLKISPSGFFCLNLWYQEVQTTKFGTCISNRKKVIKKVPKNHPPVGYLSEKVNSAANTQHNHSPFVLFISF